MQDNPFVQPNNGNLFPSLDSDVITWLALGALAISALVVGYIFLRDHFQGS